MSSVKSSIVFFNMLMTETVEEKPPQRTERGGGAIPLNRPLWGE